MFFLRNYPYYPSHLILGTMPILNTNQPVYAGVSHSGTSLQPVVLWIESFKSTSEFTHRESGALSKHGW